MNHLSESEADQAVIQSLLKELTRGNMTNYFKLEDGTVIKVKEFEVVSHEELEAKRLSLIDQLAVFNGFMNIASNHDGTVQTVPLSDEPQDLPENLPTEVAELLADEQNAPAAAETVLTDQAPAPAQAVANNDVTPAQPTVQLS